LGIAQRSVTVTFEQKMSSSKRCIQLRQNVQTLGDWVRAKRNERNLKPGHLAAKMGIAASLVCAWEARTVRPSKQQVLELIRVLGEAPTLA